MVTDEEGSHPKWWIKWLNIVRSEEKQWIITKKKNPLRDKIFFLWWGEGIVFFVLYCVGGGVTIFSICCSCLFAF